MRRLMLLLVILLISCGPSKEVPAAEVDVPPEPMAPGQVEMTLDSYEEVPIDMEQSSWEFEGYTLGKSHVGTFDEWSGTLYIMDDTIVGGRGEVNTQSVNTGIEMLDNDLRSYNFFDADKYPRIEFATTQINEGMMTGELTFLGVKKSVTFPVELKEDRISADFRLNVRDFGLKSNKVDDEVRIAFEFVR